MAKKLLTSMAFYVTGEDMTRMVRMFWQEGNCIHAFKVASSLNMPQDMVIKLVEGSLKLIGSTQKKGDYLTIEDDNYSGIQIDDFIKTFTYKIIQSKSSNITALAGYRNELLRLISSGDKGCELIDQQRFKTILINDEKRTNDMLAQLSFLYYLKNETMDSFYNSLMQNIEKLQQEQVQELEDKLNKRASRISELYQGVKFDMRSTKNAQLKSIDKYIQRSEEIRDMDGRLGSYKDSTSGYLLPNGNYYPCPEMGHIYLIEILEENEVFTKPESEPESSDYYVEKLGWIKISQKRIFTLNYKFTDQQMDFISKMILHYNMKTIEVSMQKMKVQDFIKTYEQKL